VLRTWNAEQTPSHTSTPLHAFIRGLQGLQVLAHKVTPYRIWFGFFSEAPSPHSLEESSLASPGRQTECWREIEKDEATGAVLYRCSESLDEANCRHAPQSFLSRANSSQRNSARHLLCWEKRRVVRRRRDGYMPECSHRFICLLICASLHDFITTLYIADDSSVRLARHAAKLFAPGACSLSNCCEMRFCSKAC